MRGVDPKTGRTARLPFALQKHGKACLAKSLLLQCTNQFGIVVVYVHYCLCVALAAQFSG